VDLIFIEGIAVTIAAIIVFFGTIWLLLSMVMGGRLAYFVTASVSLGFIFIMTLVWSYGTPLGPVGVMPEWHGIDVADSAAAIEGLGPATEYPEGSWEVPAEDDAAATTKAAELESAAIDFLEKQIAQDGGGDFVAATDATVTTDSALLLTQGEDQFGALTLEAADSAIEKFKEADDDQLASITPEDATAVVVMEYDPGNPLGKARTIAGGTFLVFALHLFGLSRAERKTKTKAGNGEAP
jgi:hypothetical protein